MNLFGIAVLVTILLGLFKVAGILTVTWFVVFIPVLVFAVMGALLLAFAAFGILAAYIAHRITR